MNETTFDRDEVGWTRFVLLLFRWDNFLELKRCANSVIDDDLLNLRT